MKLRFSPVGPPPSLGKRGSRYNAGPVSTRLTNPLGYRQSSKPDSAPADSSNKSDGGWWHKHDWIASSGVQSRQTRLLECAKCGKIKQVKM